MRKSIESLAANIERAHRNFVQTLKDLGGISEADAEKVKDLYLREKIAKVDAIMGVINVKHGAFLDKETIGLAVEMVHA
jgi:hypothetical protein